jgi:hypothetical protein
MRAVRAVFSGACGILLLAGCGGATKAVTVTTSAPVATIAQSASPAAVAGGSSSSVAVTIAMVKSYVDAVAAGDSDAMRAGLTLAAPNSVAYGYLDQLANQAEAWLDGGHVYPKGVVTPVGDGAFKECNNPADATSCVTFADFKVNPAGKLVDLTVNKLPIAPRLTVGNGQVVTSGGARFTFLAAYKSIQDNALVVTVKIATGDQPMTPYTAMATYRGQDGKQRTATEAVGPSTIEANSNTLVYMVFASVETGGSVTLNGYVGTNSAGSFSAVMKVG